MTFTPTPEQLLCVEAAQKTQDNLIINALAGCAKTSTLKLIMRALPSTPILYLVFNKRNADEAKAEQANGEIPTNVKIQTFNACGHGVWLGTLGRKRCVLNTDKIFTLLKEHNNGIKDRQAKNAANDLFKETLKFIKGAKSAGYVPEGKYPGIPRLCTLDEYVETFEEKHETEVAPSQREALDAVLTASITQAFDGIIDFDDQIYMPTLFGGTFSRFALVMADEAQDLSPLNHAMLRKLVTKRLIIVGDPWQSIYGFRGAVSNGMGQLSTDFKMRALTLSTSFRCPRSVIRRAQARVPLMTWPDWAAEGEVNEFSAENPWGPSLIPDGAAIICRNNAPLFKLGLTLIQSGRGVKILGADIGPGLVRILKKLGDTTMLREQMLRAIDEWETETVRRTKKVASTADRAECLRVFAGHGATLHEAIVFAEHLFAQNGTIHLLSGHKSKGLEWDTVFHLDPWRIPSPYAKETEIEQEYNVKYVIETRAKRVLNLISMEHFNAGK